MDSTFSPVAVALAGSLLFTSACLDTSTDQSKVPEGDSTSSVSDTPTTKKDDPVLSGRTGSCLIRVHDPATASLFFVAMDMENGGVTHAEFATNGLDGPTVGAADRGGERLTDGEWGRVTVTVVEDKFALVSRPKVLKLKFSGDEFEMDGVKVKGKCAWK
jgi:hypothetical protein